MIELIFINTQSAMVETSGYCTQFATINWAGVEQTCQVHLVRIANSALLQTNIACCSHVDGTQLAQFWNCRVPIVETIFSTDTKPDHQSRLLFESLNFDPFQEIFLLCIVVILLQPCFLRNKMFCDLNLKLFDFFCKCRGTVLRFRSVLLPMPWPQPPRSTNWRTLASLFGGLVVQCCGIHNTQL